MLAIGICNLLLYFAFYIIMKVRAAGCHAGTMAGGRAAGGAPRGCVVTHHLLQLRSGERIKLIPLLCIIGTSVVWGFALFFFFQGLSTWQVGVRPCGVWGGCGAGTVMAAPSCTENTSGVPGAQP